MRRAHAARADNRETTADSRIGARRGSAPEYGKQRRQTMKIAIVTLDGFNEIDSFLALNILNHVRRSGWKAELCGPSGSVVSMNGVRVELQRSLAFANDADAVLIGSGRRTLDIIEDAGLMASLKLQPKRQLIGSQCSGALILWKLGLLDGQPMCTDHATRPHAEAAGLRVLEQPFFCQGNVATAGDACRRNIFVPG